MLVTLVSTLFGTALSFAGVVLMTALAIIGGNIVAKSIEEVVLAVARAYADLQKQAYKQQVRASRRNFR